MCPTARGQAMRHNSRAIDHKSRMWKVSSLTVDLPDLSTAVFGDAAG
jgi:hypothetical protein